jgi:hypothetical protein
VERFECAQDPSCTGGLALLHFSTPVKRVDVQRYVRIEPRHALTVAPGPAESAFWVLQAPFAARARYTLTIDSAIRDVFGRPLAGTRARKLETADRTPSLWYGAGLLTLSARGPRTIALRHVNVDTALITLFRIADGARAGVLGMNQWWGGSEPRKPTGSAVEVRWPLRGSFNRDTTTLLPVDELAARVGGMGLLAIRIDIAAPTPPPPDTLAVGRRVTQWAGDWRNAGDQLPLAIVQMTDLAAHTKLSRGAGTVFVTGISDGMPRRGAQVTLFDERNVAVARGTTDNAGLATLVAVRSGPARRPLPQKCRVQERHGVPAALLEV